MKVAIAGAGSVGTSIAKDLSESGHDVLVIEKDPDLVESLRSSLPVTWVAADACEVSSLDAAGMSEVDVAVAATGDDEDNLVISLLAKQEFAVPRVVARERTRKSMAIQRVVGCRRVGVDAAAPCGVGGRGSDRRQPRPSSAGWRGRRATR